MAAAGLTALTTFVTEANALDCSALTKSTRTIEMAATVRKNGESAGMSTYRIERGDHPLVTIRGADARVTVRTQFDGIMALWSEGYLPDKPPRRQDFQYLNVQGRPTLLTEGATASWELRTIENGTVTSAADARQTIGAHASITLSGCRVATVAVHREVVSKPSGAPSTFDWLFAPELGHWVGSTVKPPMHMVFEITATSIELEK